MAVTSSSVALTSGGFDQLFEAVPHADGFWMTWVRTSGTQVTLLAQRFNSTGQAQGTPVTVEPAGINELRPELVNMADGRIAVFYSVQAGLKAAIIDPATGAVSNAQVVLPNTYGLVRDLVRLADGNIGVVTVFNDVSAAPTVREFPSLTVLRPDFSKVVGPTPFGPGQQLGLGAANAVFDFTITAVGSSPVGIFRNRADNQLYMASFGVDGAGPVGTPVRVNTTALLPVATTVEQASFEVKTAQLSGGGFVVVWSGRETGTYTAQGNEVRARVYDANGAAVGADFMVNAAVNLSQVAPEVVALQGGGFAVTWVEQTSLFQYNHFVRFYNAQGTALGAPSITQAFTPSPGWFDLETVALADGTLVNLYPQGFLVIQADGFAAPAAPGPQPTTGNDTLTGTSGPDTINLLAGDDVYTGGGGADVITGGPGADTFRYTALSDSTAGAADRITDFNSAAANNGTGDRFDVSALNATGVRIIHSGAATLNYGSTITVNTAGGDLVITTVGLAHATDVIGTATIPVYILGTNQAEFLIGGNGNDGIQASAGGPPLAFAGHGTDSPIGDVIIGGGGADALFGGIGNDSFRYRAMSDSTPTAYDTIFGFTTGIDQIFLLDLNLSAPVNIVRSGDASFLFATQGGATLQIAVAGELAGRDVFGGTNRVFMQGSNGPERLFGGDFSDGIVAGDGNDVIVGYRGGDALFGGAGADVFLYTHFSDSSISNAAVDTIFDFVSGIDKLDLTAVRTTAADRIGIAYSGGASFLFVDIGGNGSNDMLIQLTGTTLLTSDILF